MSETVQRGLLVVGMVFALASIVVDIAWCVPRARLGHEAWCSRPMWPDGAPP